MMRARPRKIKQKKEPSKSRLSKSPYKAYIRDFSIEKSNYEHNIRAASVTPHRINK